MKHFYVYYSYEEYGRGYIGKRECECLPDEDINYLGSFHDKSFYPTQKIILETFENVEKALEAECEESKNKLKIRNINRKWWVNPDGIRKFQQECPGVEWKRGMVYK